MEISYDVNYEVKGLDELLKKIGELTVKKYLNKAIKKYIFLTEREAKLRTPVKKGILVNSYKPEFDDLTGTLYNKREYAPYVEARRHFMENTRDYMDTQVKSIFEKEMQNMLNDLE